MRKIPGGYPLILIGMLSMEANDTVEELDTEWIELIQIVINLEIPIQEIKNFVSDYKRQ
ncbi:hypothetical protein QUF81_15980 [Peribacillus simplex]|uniref:hypothetical protein n=1 Tax=Peribacillus simplex TaxID=1478 RepID=UPI0025A06A3A|nr:hypothetical protein [Peribacillus simplex]MDM5294660.1 hypothetical protein [Peribacillus simplex]